MKVVFDSQSHTYWYGDKQVPNFSSVKLLVLGDAYDDIMRIIPKNKDDQMTIYQQDNEVIINNKHLKEHNTFGDIYLTRGKNVHKMIQCYIEVGATDFSLYDDEERALLTGFYDFLKDHQVEWIDSEVIMYNNNVGYVCTADIIANVNGVKTVIEVKTGKKRIWHTVQVEAQRACIDDCAQGMVLYLKSKPDEKTGKFYEVVYSTSKDAERWNAYCIVYNDKVSPRARKSVSMKPNLMGEPK
jgi:Holliday junction resolvase-like predicted endonuclease